MIKTKYITLLLLTALLGFTSCSDDDESVQPFSVSFSSLEVGVSPQSPSVEIVLVFSRPSSTAGEVKLALNPNDLSYGENNDFFTSVALEQNVIVLAFESGDENVSFTLHSGSAAALREDKTIVFSILEDEANTFITGNQSELSVQFAENFISKGATVEIDGGGAAQPFQVFIDLSKQTQAKVDKYSWDLGFSADQNEFAVVLNSSAFVMARPLDVTDIDAVTANDTIGFASKMFISNYYDTEASGWVDNQNGSFDDTAISAVSETDSENKVYIIKRDGDDRNWKKVRILRNGNNYVLQYADLDASTHEELTITKDEAFNFIHADLDNGITLVEPEKESWDLMYSTYSGVANYGVWLGIAYNDIVVLNRSNVSAVKIEETSALIYDNFSSEDIANQTLESENIFVIGDTWRGLEGFALVLRQDVFYLIEDSDGNHYKLKFTSLTARDERGYPEYKYELLD